MGFLLKSIKLYLFKDYVSALFSIFLLLLFYLCMHRKVIQFITFLSYSLEKLMKIVITNNLLL